MKKLWKKIGKYIIIVFLLLVGLACAGVLYLFFVPGSNLFNITYISNNSDHNSKQYANVASVTLNSRNYKVNVCPTDSDSVYVSVHDNSFGFVLTENNSVKISEKVTDDSLEITVSEPYGFALQNNSYINLFIPNSYKIDLNLKNNFATSDITTAGLKIDDFSYKSNHGTANLDLSLVTGNLTLDLGNSLFKTTGSSSSNVTLDLTTGKFEASQSTLGDVTVNSNSRGIVSINECKNFYEEVKTAGGRIEINKLYHALIKTSDTNVHIKEVTNNVIVDLTQSGNIEIDNLAGISDIKTNNGNAVIRKATSTELVLESKHGNITVSQAYNLVRALTNHGSISVNYAEDASSYIPSTNRARSLSATIQGNGKVQATGVENVNVHIVEKGRASITMNNVLGTNAITSTKGSVNLKINKDAKYKLKTTTTSGPIRVNLTQVPEFDGYTQKERETFVNCTSNDAEASANTLTVVTISGSINILDTNF